MARGYNPTSVLVKSALPPLLLRLLVVVPLKISKKVISTLSDGEILFILRTFNLKKPSEARNQTIFILLLDTGLRIGELGTALNFFKKK